MTKTKRLLLLFLIVTLGIFLRVYHIDSAPPGVYPDEAVNGIDALHASQENWQWFYPDNNGREGLFMNIMAVFFKFFGLSLFTFKLTSIVFGVLTVWGTYLFTKELFRSDRLGLLSSFLVATSFWAINFSRIAFRAIMLPAILVFSFYFILKGLRERKYSYFALGGFIFGLGLHTYIAFRIAPLILIIMLIVLIINRQKFLKNYWKQLLVFAIFTIISAFPMFYTLYISHPEYSESRSASISVLSPEVNGGQPIKAFLKSFSLSILKYNFWGDQNWRHNFPPYPLLDPVTGLAFILGLFYAIIKFFHLLLLRFRQKVRDEKLEIFTLLLASFFLMLAPEFMTAEGNPQALRAIGTLPFVFIFSALIFNYFLEYAEKHQPIFKKIILSVFIVMLLSVGIFNSVKYHLVWAKKIETAKAFEKTVLDITKYIETVPKNKEIFAVLGNMQRVPVRLFNINNPNFRDLHPVEINNISPKNKGAFVIVFMDYYKDEIIENISHRFPNMKLEKQTDSLGLSFWVLK